MTIDYEKIASLTGLQFDDPADVLYYLQNHIKYLATHNKNLTNAQYRRVCDIENILECLTVE